VVGKFSKKESDPARFEIAYTSNITFRGFSNPSDAMTEVNCLEMMWVKSEIKN
jgi:hypothetical protein